MYVRTYIHTYVHTYRLANPTPPILIAIKVLQKRGTPARTKESQEGGRWGLF